MPKQLGLWVWIEQNNTGTDCLASVCTIYFLFFTKLMYWHELKMVSRVSFKLMNNIEQNTLWFRHLGNDLAPDIWRCEKSCCEK